MSKLTKDQMIKKVWNKQSYYHLAHQASLDTAHPGMKILKDLATNSSEILDLGCGEGTRLNLVAKNTQKGVGVDISQIAIKMAKQKFPNFDFLHADLERVPLKDGRFDLIYSAYVLEHLENPEKVLIEAIRLVKEGGYMVLIAPNYGAPNRASPPFKGSRLKKLFNGFWQDLLAFNKTTKKLNWIKVEPMATHDDYQVDWDTTIEPYLGSLTTFLKGKI